jgi:hypothetical protein
MDDELVTISDLVEDATDGRIGWAVVAAFVRGPLGEPVCVDYRVRQVKAAAEGGLSGLGARGIGLRNGQKTIAAMEAHAQADWAGTGPFSRKGIPRYVFEEASQQRLIAKARELLERKPEGAAPKARSVFAAPERKPGRPPQRGLLEKLCILEDVENAYEADGTLADVAERNHMSRSAVRDLLSWARKDANPQLFEGITQGRRGGRMTPEARQLLEQMRGS